MRPICPIPLTVAGLVSCASFRPKTQSTNRQGKQMMPARRNARATFGVQAAPDFTLTGHTAPFMTPLDRRASQAKKVARRMAVCSAFWRSSPKRGRQTSPATRRRRLSWIHIRETCDNTVDGLVSRASFRPKTPGNNRQDRRMSLIMMSHHPCCRLADLSKCAASRPIRF